MYLKAVEYLDVNQESHGFTLVCESGKWLGNFSVCIR